MSENSKGNVPLSETTMEYSEVEKDSKDLGPIIEKLKQSKQPIPQEASTAYEDLLTAKTNAAKLNSLRRMDTALNGYDPVQEEIDSHDARALVKRMILELEKTT
jgi:hypothetical protein